MSPEQSPLNGHGEPQFSSLEQRNSINNGHFLLKWGTISTLGGFAIVFATAVMGDSDFILGVSLLGMLFAFAGLIGWVVGMIQRLRFNRKSETPLIFTIGEKIALVGSAFLVLGILLVNGEASGEGVTMARLIAILGLIGAGGGALWHLMTPRKG